MKLKYISSSALLIGLITIASLESVSAVDSIERVRRERYEIAVSSEDAIVKEKNESRGPTSQLDIGFETNGDVKVRDEKGQDVVHLYAQARKLETDLHAAYAYTTVMEKPGSGEIELSIDADNGKTIEPKYLDTLVSFGLTKHASGKWTGKFPSEKIRKIVKRIEAVSVDGGEVTPGKPVPHVRLTFSINPGTLDALKEKFRSHEFAREYALQAYTQKMILPALASYNRASNEVNGKISDDVHLLPGGEISVQNNGMLTIIDPTTKGILFDGVNNAKKFESRFYGVIPTDSVQTEAPEIIKPIEIGGSLRDEFEATALVMQQPGSYEISIEGPGVAEGSFRRIALLPEGDPLKKQLEQEGNAGWDINRDYTGFLIDSSKYSEMDLLSYEDRKIFLQFGDQNGDHNFDAAQAILLEGNSIPTLEKQQNGEIK